MPERAPCATSSKAIDTALILKDIAAENDGEAAHQPLLRISAGAVATAR